MTQINLLPWREEARQIKIVRFTALLILSLSISFFVIFALHISLRHAASNQQQIIDLITTAINDEQAELNKMKSQEDDRSKIGSQLNTIIGLYEKNYDAIRLLNELVNIVPSNIVIVKIMSNGGDVVLGGFASDDDAITLFMQDIEKSPYLNQPVLSTISQGKLKTSGNNRYFELNVKQEGGADHANQ